MTLRQADGTVPLANANVIVFYMPFNPPPKFRPPVMATARTSADGTFKATLNTAMVPHTGLADVGTGLDAFNAVVFAVAPSKQVVFWHMVMQLDHAMSASTSAITDPATGSPALAAQFPHAPGSPPGNAIVIGHSFRYVPVLAVNSAPGMHVAFNYTHDQSTSKQTTAGAAVSTAENFGSFSLFSAGGGEVEIADRSFSPTAKLTGLWHKISLGELRIPGILLEHLSARGRTATEFHEWDIDKWQGTLKLRSEYFPDQKTR